MGSHKLRGRGPTRWKKVVKQGVGCESGVLWGVQWGPMGHDVIDSMRVGSHAMRGYGFLGGRLDGVVPRGVRVGPCGVHECHGVQGWGSPGRRSLVEGCPMGQRRWWRSRAGGGVLRWVLRRRV